MPESSSDPMPATLADTEPVHTEFVPPTVDATLPQTEAAPPAWWPTIPGYEILGELGRGGMGIVYKARQTKAGRVVALKMILSNRPAGLHDKIRFRIEAEAVASLQHPNIVQLHEVGEVKVSGDDLPFFSLEFVEGGGLEKKLKSAPMPPAEAARLIEKLARAMHYAHSRGVVHRDLKPANVLLSADGEPKVADFGLAKRLDSDSDLSRSGAVLGTPHYMSPEQAEGRIKDVGPASDVYALGAILYELLTGRTPFRGESPHSVLAQVISQDPAPLRQSQPRLPVDLETICLKCLQKEPAKRYTTADSLANDLHRFLAGEPIRGRPVSRVERLIKWGKRRPALAALAGVSIVAAILLLGLGVWYNRQLSVANARLEKEKNRTARERDEAHAQRVKAEIAEKEAEHGKELAMQALAQNRQRAALSVLVYARVCSLVAHIATHPRVSATEAKADFRIYADLMTQVGDPNVIEALNAVSAKLNASNGPYPELSLLSLKLAQACREAWETSSRQDFPEAGEKLRKLIYHRTCAIVRFYLLSKTPEDLKHYRNTFWQLYWGNMAIVESKEVEQVMIAIGEQMTKDGEAPTAAAHRNMQRLSKKLRALCKVAPDKADDEKGGP